MDNKEDALSRHLTQDREQLQSVVRGVIGEYVETQRAKAEPAHRAELAEERRRREQLERRLGELEEENRRARVRAEEAEKAAAIRAELQRAGVAKVDLAFRVLREDVAKTEDGRLVGRQGSEEVSLRELVAKFVEENPELLPARMSGGTGASLAARPPVSTPPIDLDKIRPGMDPEEMDRVKWEIARFAAQTLR